jgi:endonuclease G
MLSPHTTMGLPAAASIGDVNHWLLLKDQYVVSFDSVHKVPNWVSWEMNAKWIGNATRSPSFNPDPQLPNTVPQAKNSDFDGTVYARGHMCPSGDRTDTQPDNLATFVFTNVVPQAPTSNNGPWKGLENEERQLAALGKTLFITAGPIFGAAPSAIGSGVSVPLATFKVIVVLDSATANTTSVTDSTQVIAVIMPNDATATKVWTEYRTTVRDIEAKTGLDLLSDVATATQDIVETRVDMAPPQ